MLLDFRKMLWYIVIATQSNTETHLGIRFYFGKNAFSTFAYSGVLKDCVAAKGALHFSCVTSFEAAHFFILTREEYFMKCYNCGEEIENDVEFCYFCGHELLELSRDDDVKVEEIDMNCKQLCDDIPEAVHEIEMNENEEVISYAIVSGVGKAIKLCSVIVIILSVIGSFIIMGESFAVGAAVLLISILTGLLAYGIGEIVSLLTSINHKL